MKKLILVCLIAILALSLLNANAIATLAAYKGKLSIQRGSSQLKYKNGELLMNKDLLKTGDESFAAYKYADASTTVKMFANSIVTLSANKNGKQLDKSVDIKQGKVHSSIQKGKGSFQVITPTTVASVKGTEFFTQVEDNGRSTFVVSDGEVEVRILATDEVARVGKGKTAIISPSGELLLRDTMSGDLSQIEEAELEAEGSAEPRKIRIPMLDEFGNLKYIEISY
ncbi:MAG: FecR family protein [Candidatus Cloacimonadaceae bacterium]